MKPLRLLISGFWLSFVVAVIVLALLLSAARLLLPAIGEYRTEVAAWVSAIVGQPVRIGALRAGWHGWGPSVELLDVAVLDAVGELPVLRCASARIDINIWASLREWQFEPGKLTLRGMQLSLVRREDGAIAVAGLSGAEGEMDERSRQQLRQWLQRQDRLAIEESAFHWVDLMSGGRAMDFSAVNLQLRNRDDRHRIDGTVALPESLGQSLQVAMNLQGDIFAPDMWQGQVYLSGTGVRLDEWWGTQTRFGLAALGGVIDFRAWSDWQNGLEKVEGDLHANALHAVRAPEHEPGQALQEGSVVAAHRVGIAALQGGFRWQRRAAGWTVDVDRFSITRGGPASPTAQLRVEYTEDGEIKRRVIQAGYSELRAEDVAGTLLDAGLVPEALRERLAVMAPQGILHDGFVRYQVAPDGTPHLVMRSAFGGLAFQPTAPLPGMQGLIGRVAADDERGVAAFATQTAAVDFSNLFRDPLPLEGLAGSVYWRRDQKTLQMLAKEMTAYNEDLKVQFGFTLDAPRSGGSPYLDFSASFAEGKGEHVSRYLPAKIMNTDTVAWLDRAIVNSRVTGGTARIVGRLADFPYDDGRGLFEIRFDVEDGILDYAPGWPRLEEIEAEVLFRGRSLEINATAAKSLNSDITQARVTIPNMTAKPAQLKVTGKAQGPTADAVRYVTESPLHDRFGAYLDDITAGGRSRLQLELRLPLAKLPARLKGALQIADGSLLFRGAGIDITHIAGALNFTERGISADGIRADLLGQAVTVAARTTTSPTGTLTTFSADGTADAVTMARRFAAPLAAYVEGATPWRGELRIPPKSEGWVELEVVSSLQGVAVLLPSPMGKTAEEPGDLLVQVPLPLKDDKPIHVRYGELVDAQLAVRHGKTGLEVGRGEVLFGGGTAALSALSGVRLAGKLAEFDQEKWKPVLWPEKVVRRGAGLSGLRQMDVEIGTLKLGGRQLDKVRLQADRDDAAWRLMVNSEQAEGRITIPDAEDAPLSMSMERLYLPRFKKGGGGEPDADPRKMRPLVIDAKRFHYGDLDLGELKLRASRHPAGLAFDEIHTHSDQRDMKINGKWLAEGDGHSSSFTLAYDGADSGATLTALGFAGIIKGGKAHADMRLQWRGAPQSFSLAKAEGSISFELKDGRLLDVEPGAGRVLGLLSFQALPRRLVLDFSDLFQKGFAFDTLGGSFTIENGDAQTDNLRMAGPAARIEARGRVGLAAEDYDQRVTVTPNVTGGLPVAGAIAGGVGAGAALLLAEKIFKPGIDKMTRVEYQVTGPWTNPVVERIAAVGQDRPPEGNKSNNE